jgi:hypothetical protein
MLSVSTHSLLIFGKAIVPPKKTGTSSRRNPEKRSGKNRTHCQRISSGVSSISMNLRRFERANHTPANLPHLSHRRSKRCMNFCQRTTSKTTKQRSDSNIPPSSWSGMSRVFIRKCHCHSISVVLSRTLKPLHRVNEKSRGLLYLVGARSCSSVL